MHIHVNQALLSYNAHGKTVTVDFNPARLVLGAATKKIPIRAQISVFSHRLKINPRSWTIKLFSREFLKKLLWANFVRANFSLNYRSINFHLEKLFVRF